MEIFSYNGKNATGKSTLLKLFCLKILPSRGNFYLNGKKLDQMIKVYFGV